MSNLSKAKRAKFYFIHDKTPEKHQESENILFRVNGNAFNLKVSLSGFVQTNCGDLRSMFSSFSVLFFHEAMDGLLLLSADDYATTRMIFSAQFCRIYTCSKKNRKDIDNAK